MYVNVRKAVYVYLLHHLWFSSFVRYSNCKYILETNEQTKLDCMYWCMIATSNSTGKELGTKIHTHSTIIFIHYYPT